MWGVIMAKRFTDTEKWKNPWFSSLSPKAKLAWFYILDNCDHSGVWSINLKLMSFQLDQKITFDDLNEWFSDKMILVEPDKVWIPSFIPYQYKTLNEKNNAHLKALETLEKYKHLLGPDQDLRSPCPGAQVKDKDKVKVKVKEGGLGGTSFPLEEIYLLYPRKEGKSEGIRRLKSQIKTADDFQSVQCAVMNYKKHCIEKGLEGKFIKHFSSFVSSWRDWLDPEAGSVDSEIGKPRELTVEDIFGKRKTNETEKSF